MARGMTAVKNQALGQTSLANKAAGTAGTEAGTAYSTMMPQIMKAFQPGGDPAVTAATMGALGSKFGAAKQDVMDTATRTGNAATTTAALDQLARTQGQQGAQAAAGNVMKQKQDAMGMLQKIFGVDKDQIAKLLGVGVEGINAATQAAKVGSERQGVSLGPFGRWG